MQRPWTDSELAALALWAVPGVGARSLTAIQAQVDSAALLDAKVESWVERLDGAAASARRGLAALRDRSLRELAQQQLSSAQAGSARVLRPSDADWPDAMRGLPDMPPVLFVLGAPGPPRRRLAMVGTRHPSAASRELARELADQVAAAGVTVVSGGAEGIDTCCHQAAVAAGGSTWVFLGSALDQIDRAQRLLLSGLGDRAVAMSELPYGVRADRSTFVRRNRLISAASDAVVVVRAGEGSGALHTASFAREQNKRLLAVPGEIRDASAAGCNRLIRDHEAHLCLSAAQLIAAVGGGVERGLGDGRPALAQVDVAQASKTAQKAFSLLTRSPSGFEELLAASQLSSGALTSALCELELLGLVVQHPGKRYERV